MKEKQPETWKPSIIQNDSFMSKNKKRKEKRMAKNLSIQKAETGDFIPVKKSALPAKNKNPSNGFGLSPKGNKGRAFLSTSLPIKGNKKSNANTLNNSMASSKPTTPAKPPVVTASVQPKKVTGILSNPNTPKKNKHDRVTFEEDKPKTKKFIDDEAEEGEEPITSKAVKPYQKKGKQKVVVQMEDESSDDSGDDSVNSATDLLDMEASEGEETDDESDGFEDDSDSDGDSDLSTFLADDDENDSEDDESNDDEDDESNDDEDDESNEDETPVAKPVLPSKNAKPNQPAEKPGKKQKMTAEKPEQNKSTKAAKPNTPAKTKPEKAAEKKQKQSEEKMAAENDDAKVKPEKQKPQRKEMERPSNFVGFIRDLGSKLTVNVIKSKLGEKVDSSKILQITLTKNRKNKKRNNAFVFLKDEESLDKLLYCQFHYETFEFVVCEAKSIQQTPTGKPVAFLPRVPTWITIEMLKTAVEAEIGPGKLLKIQDKKVSNKTQTRNVLVHVVDLETLKKLIYQGALMVDKESVIVREAVEAGLQIPVYRAVFADIPQDMAEAVLKKAVETNVGKNTVESIRFSFRKKSFAFVTFNSAKALTKALALGDNVVINGRKIRVLEFRQRKPKKRSTPSDETKARRAEKRKLQNDGKQKSPQQPGAKKAKQQNESSPGKGQQPSAKKPKQQNESLPVKSQQNELSPVKSDKKKRQRKPKKPASPAPSGEVKAVKNPKKSEKKKGAQPEAAAGKAPPLKQKIAAKQADLRMQKKKAKKGKSGGI